MARYDFKCEKCSFVVEHVQSMKDPLPESLLCPRCKDQTCMRVFSVPMISKAGMTHEPFDISVGRDAEVRWADIRRRQELRNQVRKESGTHALTMTGRNEFQPLKDGKLGTVETGKTDNVELPTNAKITPVR